MCLRLSTSLIYPWVTGIKITLGDIMKFHLSHQLMQHKSIFVQTGRATYITVMTMQSQGGTTNEPKCDYSPPRHLKTKQTLRQDPSGHQRRGQEFPMSPLSATIGFPATIWIGRADSSLWLSLADGSAAIFLLTSMNWLKFEKKKKKKEIKETSGGGLLTLWPRPRNFAKEIQKTKESFWSIWQENMFF